MIKTTTALLLLGFGHCLAAAQLPSSSNRLHPVVLITASDEMVTASTVTGAATAVGSIAVGSAGKTTSTYEHSEVWEVLRRFTCECPDATFVTNPATPHTYTIHTDYQKLDGLVTGGLILYQLALLDPQGNPLYVSKKEWLRREVKPICKILARASTAS